MDDKPFEYEVVPCEKMNDISQHKEYKKLEFTKGQSIQFNGLFQQLPAMAASGSLQNAFYIRLPEGLPDGWHLMGYGNGGIGSPIHGADGKIVAHASFEQAKFNAVILNGFAAMAVVSGQYFLAQINSELHTINQGLDKILEFLYSDKKSELIAEVSFAKYAYQNYSSIVSNSEQRIATITSLQAAKKVAIKDIEFYMSDLSETVNSKTNSDINALVEKVFRIKDCLELSMQLYVMSGMLEVYYASNRDAGYLQWLEDDAITYLSKCEKRMLSCFSMLSMQIHNYKENLLKKVDKEPLIRKVDEVIDIYSKGTESEICNSFRSALRTPGKAAEYYVDDDKVVYFKVS